MDGLFHVLRTKHQRRHLPPPPVVPPGPTVNDYVRVFRRRAWPWPLNRASPLPAYIPQARIFLLTRRTG